MKSLKKWKLLRSQLVLNHQWCQVRRDEIELPGGQIIDDFFVTIRPDVAVIFTVTENQEIIFVRQYRHGVGEFVLELPAGGFNPEKETPESAVMREFTEETGYSCDTPIKLATLYGNPVKETNQIHLFIGLNAKKTGQQILDLTEEIEVVLVPVAEVMDKINTGEICVSGTVAAIFLGLNYLKTLSTS